MNVKCEKREEVTRDLVHMFSEALERVDFEELYNVVKRLPERAYPKAKEVLSMVQGDPVIISCALQQVVNSYCVFLNARGVGNPLRQKSEGVSNEGRGVYGAEDKEFVADFVCQEYERAVVFGDEYEDVGMAKVAKEINPESVVVAMHGRSEELEDVADIVANSWEDVGEFVYSNWNKACMSKSEREVA